MNYRLGPQTARLRLRAMSPEDAEAFFRLCSDPRVMQFTGESPCPSVAAARDALAAYPDFEQVGYGRWGCYRKDTDDLIGFCGLKYLSDRDLVDVGYRFLPAFWGQGLATEACAASLAFGFETIALDEIWALVLPANLGSLRVLEKVGMRRREDGYDEGQLIWQFALRRDEFVPSAPLSGGGPG